MLLLQKLPVSHLMTVEDVKAKVTMLMYHMQSKNMHFRLWAVTILKPVPWGYLMWYLLELCLQWQSWRIDSQYTACVGQRILLLILRIWKSDCATLLLYTHHTVPTRSWLCRFSVEKQRGIQHRDVLDPHEDFSAGQFYELARTAIADILQTSIVYNI